MNVSTKLSVSQFNKNDASVVVIDGLESFDVGKIFDCGQCFRFDEVQNSNHQKEFSGVAYGRFVSFAQDENRLYIYGSTIEDYELIWRRFLAIEEEYSLIDADILASYKSEALERAVEYGNGIRILDRKSVV